VCCVERLQRAAVGTRARWDCRSDCEGFGVGKGGEGAAVAVACGCWGGAGYVGHGYGV
jgi:hypothetical protein